MPIKTRVPVGDERATGGKRSPVSLSDLEEVYGEHGLVGQVAKYVEYIDDGSGYIEAECTFVASDPAEQDALDSWVAQFDLDTPAVMREKVNAAAAEAARAVVDGDDPRVTPMAAATRVV